MPNEVTYRSSYLEHYGIKGQKWGVRRFQNEDGTITAAGKERYYSKTKRAAGVEDVDRKKWRPRDARNLSDEELNRRNTRLQKEQQYRDLTTPRWKKETVNFAKESFKKIFITSAVTVIAKVVMKKYQSRIDSWAAGKTNIPVKDMSKAACDIGASVLRESTAIRPYSA